MVTVGRVAMFAAMICLNLVDCVLRFAQFWLWVEKDCASCKGLARM